VECLPLDIPEFFNVEVSALDIGDSVHIEELSIPEGVMVSNPFAWSPLSIRRLKAPTTAAAPEERRCSVRKAEGGWRVVSGSFIGIFGNRS
jgi:large subunit ribosomal protein L25